MIESVICVLFFVFVFYSLGKQKSHFTNLKDNKLTPDDLIDFKSYADEHLHLFISHICSLTLLPRDQQNMSTHMFIQSLRPVLNKYISMSEYSFGLLIEDRMKDLGSPMFITDSDRLLSWWMQFCYSYIFGSYCLIKRKFLKISNSDRMELMKLLGEWSKPISRKMYADTNGDEE